MIEIEGFKFEPIRDEYAEELRKNSVAPKQSNAELLVHPSRCVLTFRFQELFHRIWNFEIYPDDTWIVTYPKSGTTWSQEMIWLLKNKLDYQTAKSVHLQFRCPFLEWETLITENKFEEKVESTLDLTETLKRPRCIKSHLPVQLLPKALWTVKPKIIYVSRDPRDVAISYYHHYRMWNGYQGNLNNFTEAFIADRVVYSPYWSHVLDFWNLEDKSHVLFNNFEEMNKNLAKVIKKTAKFLEVEITEKEVEELKQHLSFSSMKTNNNVNFLDIVKKIQQQSNIVDDNLEFIRKGESGGWRNTFSKEMLEKFKKWTDENLSGTQYTEYPFSSTK